MALKSISGTSGFGFIRESWQVVLFDGEALSIGEFTDDVFTFM